MHVHGSIRNQTLLSVQCKAVFFTKEEQQRHPCLNKAGSSGTTAFPVDITQPVTFCQAPATQTENAHLVTPRLVRHACSPNKRTTPQIVHNLSEMPTSVLRRMATAPSVIHRADGGPDQCHCPVASCQPLDRPQGPTKDAVVMCSSCGDIYENSGDALSSFDVPVSSSRGHQCPHSPAVHGGDADGLGELWLTWRDISRNFIYQIQGAMLMIPILAVG